MTQVFVPRDFDLDRLFAAFVDWDHIGPPQPLLQQLHLPQGPVAHGGCGLARKRICLLKEDAGWVSPVGALHYQRYDALVDVEARLEGGRGQIQCRVGQGGLAFGSAQIPGLSDYADGVDTMAFLLALEA